MRSKPTKWCVRRASRGSWAHLPKTRGKLAPTAKSHFCQNEPGLARMMSVHSSIVSLYKVRVSTPVTGYGDGMAGKLQIYFRSKVDSLYRLVWN